MYGVIANRCYLNSFQIFFLLGNKSFKKKSDAVTKLINIYDEIGFFFEKLPFNSSQLSRKDELLHVESG